MMMMTMTKKERKKKSRSRKTATNFICLGSENTQKSSKSTHFRNISHCHTHRMLECISGVHVNESKSTSALKQSRAFNNIQKRIQTLSTEEAATRIITSNNNKYYLNGLEIRTMFGVWAIHLSIELISYLKNDRNTAENDTKIHIKINNWWIYWEEVLCFTFFSLILDGFQCN